MPIVSVDNWIYATGSILASDKGHFTHLPNCGTNYQALLSKTIPVEELGIRGQRPHGGCDGHVHIPRK